MVHLLRRGTDRRARRLREHNMVAVGSSKNLGGGRTRSTSPGRPKSKGTIGVAVGDASFGLWAGTLFVICVMAAVCDIITVYPALKLDLKAQMGWDEPTLNMISNISNLGVIFVHLGWLYDRFGPVMVVLIGAACKLGGMLGMAWLVEQGRSDLPLLFGLMTFLQDQGTGVVLLLGQAEPIRRFDIILVVCRF